MAINMRMIGLIIIVINTISTIINVVIIMPIHKGLTMDNILNNIEGIKCLEDNSRAIN